MKFEDLEQLIKTLPERIEVPVETPPAVVLAERVFPASQGWYFRGGKYPSLVRRGDRGWESVGPDNTRRVVCAALRRCVTWRRGEIEVQPWGTAAHVAGVLQTLALMLPPAPST